MRITQPGIPEVVPPRPVQALHYVRGGEIEVAYICCIEGREPKTFEILDFAEDGIHEVHPYAQVQISEHCFGENFYSHFFNAREIQIPFLDRISVNGSVQWIDVPRPFGETGIVTAA